MKLILFFVLLLPCFSYALDCKSEGDVIKLIERDAYGQQNLHIFRSRNALSKDVDDQLRVCSWGTVRLYDHTEYETYPAFEAQYKCRGVMGSPYITFTGLCYDDSINMKNIEPGFDEEQFP